MHKNTFFDRKETLNCRGRLISLVQVKIMGILNVTPDSFYDGGKYNQKESVFSRVEQMVKEGADIIDVGAMSSRPGAELISSKDEVERLKDVLDGLTDNFPNTFFSIDTVYAETAEFAMQQGLHIINDISGGKIDREILDVVAQYGAPYVLTHMKGQPSNMQNDVKYDDVIVAIVDYFIEQIEVCREKGVSDIVLDPGIGFGKSTEDNYGILRSLEDFAFLNLPVLIGLSRKSLITKLLNINKHNSLNATSILNFYTILNGAKILRVHDVREAKEAVVLAEQLLD